MDLVDTLRNKIEALGEQDCVPGLRAVLLHIVTAFRHLSRGQELIDDTAFTDAIYRTNQAFEGSVKEAYRVLASKNPDRKKPHEIEQYLEEHSVFRPRVLSQLTNYRTNWRNPSAHDYQLDFDESEAFLAIISVSAFSCLLLDQITERVAFNAGQAEAKREEQGAVDQLESARERGLFDLIVQILLNFSAHSCLANNSAPTARETQILGGITGYISSAAGDLSVSTYDEAVQSGADLLISDHRSTVALEVTMASPLVHRKIESSVRYLLSVVRKSPGVEAGILVIWSSEPLVQTELNLPIAGERISVLAPARLRIPTDLLAPTRMTDIPEPLAMV
ncbi:hypothetical protein [Pseudomonas putida]|uniref:hypothetical protein n=1 Tax=Pseudomonas putida TaxID=303 RepID=UPI000E6B0878|nr:hypothetical protein [Pseudomonas putida]RIZ40666.1 hypothetical protein CIK02_13645 [Pseudomonas putida]